MGIEGDDMQDFRQLKVWEKAHRLTLSIYRLTEGFPKAEVYGLTAQLRRAAVSIPANIAEGRGLETDRAFGRFLRIALGSAFEVEYEMLLARDLGYIGEEIAGRIQKEIEEVKRMLTALIQTVKNRTNAIARDE